MMLAFSFCLCLWMRIKRSKLSKIKPQTRQNFYPPLKDLCGFWQGHFCQEGVQQHMLNLALLPLRFLGRHLEPCVLISRCEDEQKEEMQELWLNWEIHGAGSGSKKEQQEDLQLASMESISGFKICFSQICLGWGFAFTAAEICLA